MTRLKFFGETQALAMAWSGFWRGIRTHGRIGSAEPHLMANRRETRTATGGPDSAYALVAPALEEFGDCDALPYLQTLLNAEDASLRSAARMAICRLRDFRET
jgi:hypothetical protein